MTGDRHPLPENVLAHCPLQALRADGARWTRDGVVVVRDRGQLYAFEEQCPHGAASLAAAPIVRGALVCPSHGARFRLRDGKVTAGPARRALTCYETEPTEQELVVRVRREPVRVPLRARWAAVLGRLWGSDGALTSVAGGMFGFVSVERSPDRVSSS